MSWEQTKLDRLDVAAISDVAHQTVAILAVGEPEEWLQSGQKAPSVGNIEFVSINEVNSALLEHLCPTVVISPALSRRFDCIDLAQILCSHKFKGRYRAVSRELPNPSMVEREIRNLCPGLDFAILVDK